MGCIQHGQNGMVNASALVMQMVLKCADIGHLAVNPQTHKRWAFQLEEEFFRQVNLCVLSCSCLRIFACCICYTI